MRWLLVPCLLATACWHDSAKAPPAEHPKPVIKDIVQPVKIEKEEIGGVEGGEEGDICGGVVGGVVSAPPPPPPPPPPVPPQNIPPTMLEGLRIAGNNAILPDDPTKLLIQRAGKDKLVASFKLCIDVAGEPTIVTPLKSSGYADYDAKIQRGMRTWRYRPYQLNGRPVPVCTAVTFIYVQPLAPPPPAKP